MSEIVQVFSAPVAERIGWILIHSLWQGAIVALLLAVTLRLMQQRSAQTRYVCSSIALLVIVSCTLVTNSLMPSANGATQSTVGDRQNFDTDPVVVPVTSSNAAVQGELPILPTESDVKTATVDSLVVPPPSETARSKNQMGFHRIIENLQGSVTPILPWLVVGWLTGVVFCSLRLMVTWRHVRMLRTTHVAISPQNLQSTAKRLADRMGLRRSVKLLESKLIEVPMVFGWLKPVILLPVTVATGLNAIQIEAILAHELTHVRRWDYPVNLLQSVVETILFYHPAVWWVSKIMRQERENCCDDIASELCGDRVTYARALLQMEELRQPDSLILAATGGDLIERVRRLIAPANNDGSVRDVAGLVVLLLVGSALAGIRLAAVRGSLPAEGPIPVRLNVPQQELTPSKMADSIEEAMERFESAEYTAETTATVNTNALRTDAEPVLVEGNTQYLYRSDGSRWFVDEKAFTYTQGESEVRPEDRMAGFDGALHYSVDRFGSYNLGEEDLSETRLSPRAVFWRGGRADDRLLSALRHDEAVIESERQVDGRRVIRIVSEWTRGENTTRFEIEVLPDHSWLPQSTKIFRDGRQTAVEAIEALAQSDNGTWYPKRIHWSETPGPYVTTQEKTINVTSLSLDREFKASDFASEIPVGKTVVDHRDGTTWINDPWWRELSPWLSETLDWPRPDMSRLRDLQSYADNAIDGNPAPPIQAAEWIVGEDPGPWGTGDRRPTLLYFFGGRAISPSPDQLAALKALAEQHREPRKDGLGLRVIGVVPASSSPGTAPEKIRDAVKELQVNFPVAADTPNEAGGYGKTFAAYGLKHYTGIVVIDTKGVVHIVDPSRPQDESDSCALASVLKKLRLGAVNIDDEVNRDRSMSRQEHDRVEAEWKRLAAQANGTGTITGQIEVTSEGRDVFGTSSIDTTMRNGVAATIEVMPILTLAQTSAFHRLNIRDQDRYQVTTCANDGKFEIAGLCRGEYRITITGPDLARTERTIFLNNDAAAAEVSVLLNQSNSITGTVVDTSGKPIVGATISATKRHFDPDHIKMETSGHLPPQTTSDKGGKFVFEALFVGAYTLHIEADGYEPTDSEPVPAGRDSFEVELTKSGE